MRRVARLSLLNIVVFSACTGYRTAPRACVPTTYEAQVLADSPLVYYRMNDTSLAGGLADSSGNGQTATVQAGSPTVMQTPAFAGSGYSIGFSGAEVFRRVVSGLNVSAGTRITVEAWVYWTFAGVAAYIPWSFVGSGDYTIFDFAGTVPDYLGYASGNGDVYGLSDNTNAYRSTWLHLVADIAVDALQRESFFYINGARPSYALVAGAEHTTDILNGAMEIGRFYGGGGFWVGKIDELAIYNGSLSASRVLLHYQLGTGAVTCINNY